MEQQKFTIREWSKDDRPREKLLKKGVASLSDAELLAIIIGSGSKKEDAVELSRKILHQTDNKLRKLGKLGVADLKKHEGIGEAKAISIIAAMELGRRRSGSEVIEKKKITCSKDIFLLFHPALCDLPHEEFWTLFLSRSNRIIDMQRISSGGLSETSVDLRMIMKMAIEKLALSIVLCHNHPSGHINPSQQDIQVTKKIKAGAALLDIVLLDHIIVTENDYYSFTDEGII